MPRILRCLLLFAALSLIGAGCEPQKQPDEPGSITPADDRPTADEPNDSPSEPSDPNGAAPPTAINQPSAADEPNQPLITEPNEPNGIDLSPVDVNDVGVPDQATVEPNGPIIVEPNEVAVPGPNTVEAVEAPNEPDDSPPVEPNDVQEPAEPNDANDTAGKAEPNEPEPAFCEQFADFFKTYVNSEGLVDYESLRRYRPQLKMLLARFDELEPDVYANWSRDQRLAFWINAYNMNLLNIIVQNYPINASRWFRLMYGPNSIRHISGIDTDYKFMVMREEFTLRRVRDRIFRKQFDDPRVFLALSMACASGPPLRNEPYCGEKLDKQLDRQVKAFLDDPRAFAADPAGGEVRLSPLFQANDLGKDFLKKHATDKRFKDQQPETRAVLNFISSYVSERVVSFLETGNYSVKFIKFDWTIDHQP